jgi:hypothetical protein
MRIFWKSSPALICNSKIFFFVLVVISSRCIIAFLTAMADEFSFMPPILYPFLRIYLAIQLTDLIKFYYVIPFLFISRTHETIPVLKITSLSVILSIMFLPKLCTASCLNLEFYIFFFPSPLI